jgi:hypothetical protein
LAATKPRGALGTSRGVPGVAPAGTRSRYPHQREDPRQWLLDWLNKGGRASIPLTEALDVGIIQSSARLRQTLRYLYPYIKDARLQIAHTTALSEADLAQAPRISVGTEEGARAWISAQPLVSILDSLLPEPVYQTSLDGAVAERLKQLEAKADYHPADHFQDSVPIERWELKAGAARNFSTYFVPAQGAHIEEIVVRDPYCGVEDSSARLSSDCCVSFPSARPR